MSNQVIIDLGDVQLTKTQLKKLNNGIESSLLNFFAGEFANKKSSSKKLSSTQLSMGNIMSQKHGISKYDIRVGGELLLDFNKRLNKVLNDSKLHDVRLKNLNNENFNKGLNNDK